MKDGTWHYLYNQAVSVCDGHKISDCLFTGSVAAAVLTEEGNIYKGVSIDTACSIGYCAERNAIGNMLTEGDTTIKKIVAVKGTKVIMPCGVCREFMMQLGGKNRELEVLANLDPIRVIKLSELIPNYWA